MRIILKLTIPPGNPSILGQGENTPWALVLACVPHQRFPLHPPRSISQRAHREWSQVAWVAPRSSGQGPPPAPPLGSCPASSKGSSGTSCVLQDFGSGFPGLGEDRNHRPHPEKNNSPGWWG